MCASRVGDDIIDRIIRDAYDNMLNRSINTDIFDGLWQHYEQAIQQGREADLDRYQGSKMYEQLRFQTAVFAGFRSRQIQNELLGIMLDEHAVIMPFEQYYSEAQIYLRNTFGNHLQTECEQIIKRMHEWSEWQGYEENADILPNLKWMPSTSVLTDPVHREFWELPVIQPVRSEFWNKYRPGDHWGCKCTLEPTEEEETPSKALPTPSEYHSARGMKYRVNSVGMLIDTTHPAFHSGNSYLKNIAAETPHRVYDVVVQKYGIRPAKTEFTADKLNAWKESEDGLYYTTPSGVKVSAWADISEIEDNARVAEVLRETYPNIDIEIREHLPIYNRKNAEYLINAEIADAKRIGSEEGIRTGAKAAKEQSAKRVIYDLDKHIENFPKLKTRKISSYIFKRKAVDFDSGDIDSYFFIYRGKCVEITSSDVAKGEKWIEQLLETIA